jgi:predicted nucleotidyltransferase
MEFGLRQLDLDQIVHILQKFSAVEKALIFGSRAKGNYKKGSDVDIAVMGRCVDHQVVAALSFQLNEESLLPYFFDIVHFDKVKEKELIEHIKRVGKCIYEREVVV